MIKKCALCQNEKLFECFSKTSKGDKFGLRSRCKECRSNDNLKWHQKNSIKSKENHDKWLNENRERSNRVSREWVKNNKERHAQNNSKWKKENRTRNAFNSRRLKFNKNSATPSWLSSIQLAQIQEFYDISLAKFVQTGVKYHVDHIHPLMGDGFIGLHVPWNLQVIPAKVNISKKNKVPSEEKHLFWSK